MPKLIYLAAPYTDPNPEVSALRAAQAAYAAAMLMSRYGFVVYSPITHGHAVAPHLDFAGVKHDHDFWMGQCLPLLGCCDLLVVVPLPGWEKSRGIAAERKYASDCNMPELFWSTYPRPEASLESAWDEPDDGDETFLKNLL